VVYTRSGSVWTQQGAELVGTGAVGTAKQGSSVSLSGDGNTADAAATASRGVLEAACRRLRTGAIQRR
jgi:hypothetical protein